MDGLMLLCASGAEGAGTCDVEGCGGRVVEEELVYACTAHNKYAISVISMVPSGSIKILLRRTGRITLGIILLVIL